MKIRKAVLFISFLIVIILILLSAIHFLSPKKIIQSTSDFSLTRVLYKGEEVTKLVNEKQIAALLYEYNCKRTFGNYFPYKTTDIMVEIDGTNSGRPLHILLGKFFVSYESVDKGVYKIIEINC